MSPPKKKTKTTDAKAAARKTLDGILFASNARSAFPLPPPPSSSSSKAKPKKRSGTSTPSSSTKRFAMKTNELVNDLATTSWNLLAKGGAEKTKRVLKFVDAMIEEFPSLTRKIGSVQVDGDEMWATVRIGNLPLAEVDEIKEETRRADERCAEVSNVRVVWKLV